MIDAAPGRTPAGPLSLAERVGVRGRRPAPPRRRTMTTLNAPLAAGLAVAEPEDVGLSAERLARIGPVMQGFVDAGEIPGCVTVVARHGRIAHLEARGRLHLDADAPLRADTIFRLASATKAIAAVALLLLYEEGRFLLDEPIARFLPAAAGMQVVDGETGQTAP